MSQKKDKITSFANLFFLIFLGLISAVLLFYRYRVQVVRGPGWDSFAFLANALDFAGKGIGYVEPHRPPFLSFLVSLVFRLGWVSERAIFAVDAFLVLFGIIGFYLLLNQRFKPVFSLLGCLLFLAYPAVMKHAATGYTDLASVAFSIWAFYLFVLGRKKKKGLFLALAFVFFASAVLTRFTALLLLFPVLFLILIRPSEEDFFPFKPVFLGFLAFLFFYLPFAFFYLMKFGNPFFPFGVAFGAVSDPSLAAESFAYEPDLSWYLVNLDHFVLGEASKPLLFFIIALVLVGLALEFYRLASSIDLGKLAWVILISLAYIFIFLKGTLFIRQLSVFLLCFLLFLRTKEGKGNFNLWLSLGFLSWFLAYFDFHSHLGVKVERYFVVMAPGFTYLLLLGLEKLKNLFSGKKTEKFLTASISFFLVGLIIFALSGSFRKLKPQSDKIVADAKRTAFWLKEQDVSQAVVYSDIWPVFSWYLRKNVLPMPSFKDPRAFNHELEKKRADYFLTIRRRKLPSYDLVKKFGTVGVYRANFARFHPKPRLLFIGRFWQNYLEEVLGFKYFVEFEVGRYGLGRTTYLDNLSFEELKRYPLVFLYNFRWKDENKAQRLLIKYLEGGGSIFVDLSANLGGVSYNLEGRSFLGVLVERKSLFGQPKIVLRSDLGFDQIRFSPFVSEEGGEWYGASYFVPSSEEKMKKLVWTGRKVLIGEQNYGRGKIYWMGYNLLWHAFIKKNPAERRLIQKLVEQALKKQAQ